jgi:hypothetical protein
MTHRKIKDGDGKAWDVWEVYPSAVEQRMSGEHPAVLSTDGTKRDGRQVRILVPAALQQGWLAFQCGAERRRLAPIPEKWISLCEQDLLGLLERADRIPRSEK